MSDLYPSIDPDGLIEYSVVYTDRSLNHMSQSFQGVMKDISSTLKQVYNAHAVAIVPGSGTFGMEAVARQFATGNALFALFDAPWFPLYLAVLFLFHPWLGWLALGGAALLLEMHYRAQPYRDTDALTGFMDGAERSVLTHLGAAPRIRCFAVDAAGLSARH